MLFWYFLSYWCLLKSCLWPGCFIMYFSSFANQYICITWEFATVVMLYQEQDMLIHINSKAGEMKYGLLNHSWEIGSILWAHISLLLISYEDCIRISILSTINMLNMVIYVYLLSIMYEFIMLRILEKSLKSRLCSSVCYILKIDEQHNIN